MHTKLTRAQIQEIKAERQYRSFALQLHKGAEIDEENRRVPVAFSSEDPYLRWYGWEILGHDKAEVGLDFLGSGTAPLLDQHNHSKIIGVIEEARIDKDRKGRAVVRFGKSAYATEVYNDVLDGIRCNISVGYEVHNMKLIEEDEEKGDTYRITWSPFEISLVSVPADKTVGVGRSAEERLLDQQTTITKGKIAMEQTPEEKAAAKAAKEAKEAKERAEIRRQFDNDRRDIMAIGQKHAFEEKALEWISEGKSPDDFRAYVLEELGKRGMKPAETRDVEIGLSEKEVESFSFIRAINAMANPNNRKAQEAAGFEFEASRAVADKMGSAPNGIYVPLEVLKRELTVGAPGTGSMLVSTNLLTGSFIDLMRNRMMVQRMGARVLSGLVGDIAIPRQIGGAATFWVGENIAPADTEQLFDQVPLTPKTQAGRTNISRKMLLQSSLDIENFVRLDLAVSQALGIDRAAIDGIGGPFTPLGILNTNGVGAVIGGAAGALPDWADIVGLWSEVAQDNADVGSLGYLTNARLIGTLMTTEKAVGTAQFIVKDFPDSNGFTSLAGARCGVSNQVPADLDKGGAVGICSAIIYGNWADLIIAMWGSLDIVVDNTSSNDGSVTVKTYQDIDISVRHPDSFAIMADALTN
jgi:HK97 family phage major capsid protein